MTSGRQQEGVYAGFSVSVRNLPTGIALSIIGPASAWSDYAEGAAQQTPGALSTIRLLIPVLPAALLMDSILVAWAYPITRQKHAEMQTELVQR